MGPPDFTPGMELESAELNELGAATRGAAIIPDGSSGLVGWALPSGNSLRNRPRLEFWFAVGAAVSGGGYTCTQQVDKPGGTWATGARVVTAYATPGSGTPPTNGSAIVRAFKDLGSWYFEWGTCS
jgi:hypothetical protein